MTASHSDSVSELATDLVSIGLPVYNGERFVGQAIESVLAQTYQNIELIICDNASTDRTVEICQAYADRDSRVRLHRNPANIGAARNFNLTVSLAKGKYFKWAAHDDLLAPTFVEECVRALAENPDCVLAYPRAQPIDEASRKSGVYEVQLATDSADPIERFDALMKGHLCYEVFGLIDAEKLKTTSRIGEFSHGDGILLVQLALIGRFYPIQETLFFPRTHKDQSMKLLTDDEGKFKPDYRTYAVWFNPDLEGRLLFPWWRMQFEYFKAIWRFGRPFRVKYRCTIRLVKWLHFWRIHLKADVKHNIKYVLQKVPGLNGLAQRSPR